jgi:biotin operon repressor
MNCGKVLSHNEIGAHLKFVNRASTSFLCRECLAAKFDIPPELIDKKIEQLKEQGCTLFV